MKKQRGGKLRVRFVNIVTMGELLGLGGSLGIGVVCVRFICVLFVLLSTIIG